MHDFLDILLGCPTDDLEALLKKQGHKDLVVQLNRLSVDAAIDYMTLKTSGYDPEAGEVTASISDGHTPVTIERLQLLKKIKEIFPDNPCAGILCEAVERLSAVPQAPSLRLAPSL